MRVLPADVYDTLEFSALVYGGIGGPDAFEYMVGERAAPVCLFGHASWAENVEFLEDGPVTKALEKAGFDGVTDSDAAVDRINLRKRRAPWTDNRVTFPEWCAELGVVRGR